MEEVCNGTENTLEHHFCCLAWFSRCKQDSFDLPHLICQDTDTMSLNSCCMGALIKKHAIFIRYTVTSDMISPCHIAWALSMRDNPSHICKSVRLSISLVKQTSEKIVMVCWLSPGLCLLLDHNSFMNSVVSVSHIHTKLCVQWGRRSGHNLPFSHGVGDMHISLLCHVIIMSPSAPTLA